MAFLQASVAKSCYCISSSHGTEAIAHVPKIPRVSLPNVKLIEGLNLNGITYTIPIQKNVTESRISHDLHVSSSAMSNSRARRHLYAILEAVENRVEMHRNVGQQRDNWNTLLLNSINVMILGATTMAGVAYTTVNTSVIPLLALKLSSTLLFSGATGMLIMMNKLQPSQLAEEQRNAARLFKELQSQIQTTLAVKAPTYQDVKHAMEKVLALDKAYPLPLLGGAMLDKFPAQFEPAMWWPSTQSRRKPRTHERKLSSRKAMNNGWSMELEIELKEVVEVMKMKDMKEYERLGNLVLKINKVLAILGPLLTGIAALGSAFGGIGSWTAITPLIAGALAATFNAFQHGGQVGMVFEMYRNCGGLFQQLQTSIEATLDEDDVVKRENGELFEMEVALKLGRSLSELRELARKSAISRLQGDIAVDEFASKLF